MLSSLSGIMTVMDMAVGWQDVIDPPSFVSHGTLEVWIQQNEVVFAMGLEEWERCLVREIVGDWGRGWRVNCGRRRDRMLQLQR